MAPRQPTKGLRSFLPPLAKWALDTPAGHRRVFHIAAKTSAQRKIKSYMQQYTDNQNISFLPAILATPHACTANVYVFSFYRPTGRPRRISLLPQECHRNTTRDPFSTHCLLPELEEQGQTRGGKSGGVADQSQYQSTAVA